MASPTRRNNPPEPSGTRTDRDLVMIILGVCLVLFFITAGVLSLMETNDTGAPRMRGPVKDPAHSELRIPDAPVARGTQRHAQGMAMFG